MSDLSALSLAALILAAFVAGWVDAVVGGGGLIQLPALLIGLPSSTPPAVILGTNKISSFCGTATSSLTYALRIPPDWRTIMPLVVASAVGSAVGASLAKLLPRDAFTPIVLLALIGVGIYIWRRPQLGMVSMRKHAGRGHYGLTALIGLGVGAYDGFLGPGTGSFFVILLVVVLGYGFLEASATAKIANLVTNLSAIVVFGLSGFGAVGARADDGRGQPGGWLPGCPDRDQPRERLCPQGLPRGTHRPDHQAGVRRGGPAGTVINCSSPAMPPSGAPQERAVFMALVSAVSACCRSGWSGRGSQPKPAEGLQRGLHTHDQLAGGRRVARDNRRHVRRLGSRDVRGVFLQPGDQPIPEDALGKQLALGFRALLAEHLQLADRQLVAVHDCMQLADQLLDRSDLGEDLDRLPISDRACGGRVSGADRRSEAPGSG